MTELEMSVTLGILPEPEKNRVEMDPFLRAELNYLEYVFRTAKCQKRVFGPVNPELWCEMLPWNSLN